MTAVVTSKEPAIPRVSEAVASPVTVAATGRRSIRIDTSFRPARFLGPNVTGNLNRRSALPPLPLKIGAMSERNGKARIIRLPELATVITAFPKQFVDYQLQIE
ncbi:hypothetical protein MRX96_054970 [Rhipicephalus microplus]